MTKHAPWLFPALFLATCLMPAPRARAGLEEYVKNDDPTFAWKVVRKETKPEGTVSHIKLTSQLWHGITWEHQLRIYEPTGLGEGDAVLLFITGGSTTSKPSDEDDAQGFALARLCGARCAVLPQVPNQPLLGGKTEDTLISETFVRFLDTKDESWPLLFPMVKSAVRAMDAVQAWAKAEGKPAVTRFVVTGGSKRGWTTWLTGAVDRRVVAIAPMVIDTLNMKAQSKHALESWGKQSEQIGDYTSRGLTEKFETPDGQRLWKMVDPYTYRHQLTIPKLLINGTNDRYWTLDALNIYWDDLEGPKNVVYLPNAGHGLEQNRSYALNGIGAFFRHATKNRPMPRLTWKHTEGDDGKLRLEVGSDPKPRSAKLWVATVRHQGFPRVALGLDADARGRIDVPRGSPRPTKGFVALFGDLEFEGEGFPYHLSTQVRISGEPPVEKDGKAPAEKRRAPVPAAR